MAHGDPGRPGPSKTSPKMIAAREKRQQAIRLRRAGVQYDEIAARVGFKDRRSAQRAVVKELESFPPEDVAIVRAMEVERLDALLFSQWRRAMDGDGWAVDRVLRVMERRSRLLGLDAPMRQQLEVITDSVLDEEIARLTAQLAAREAALAAGRETDPDATWDDTSPTG
jgi:hypothetical protein